MCFFKSPTILAKNTEISSITELVLADNDYKNFQLIQSQTAAIKMMNRLMCYNTKNLLKMALKYDDEFFTLHGANDQEIVLHSYKNRIYVPHFTRLNLIYVADNLSAFKTTRFA